MAIPGMVLGLAYLFFFNDPGNPLHLIYGTIAILVILTVIHFYTVAHLTAITALKQMDPEFEAVSASLKQPVTKVFARVTVPVCLPAILDISIYLFVSATQRRMLEPVQRALAREWGAVLARGLELPGEGREHRVVAQLVVVDQIFVAKGNAEHPLRHQGRDGVLHLGLRATIGEARREPPDQADRPVGRAEQQPAGVRGVVAAIERGHYLAALDHFIPEQVAATLTARGGRPRRCL